MQEGDWASSLAAALVTHAPLNPEAARGLKAALGTSSVIIALANGEDELESFALLDEGSVNTAALFPTAFVSLGEPSAALRAIKHQDTILIESQTAGREELADWRRLHASGSGVTWLLAAPLISTLCTSPDGIPLQHGSHNLPWLLGAVLVGGRGEQPTVDRQWLSEWACEMAALISPASVQLMECSLEMLSVIFPPKVLEQLVANAARKTGQTDLAEVLQQATSSPGTAGGSSWRGSSAGGRSPATAPSSARSSLGDGAKPPLPGTYHRRVPSSDGQQQAVQGLGQSGAGTSPFAAGAMRAQIEVGSDSSTPTSPLTHPYSAQVMAADGGALPDSGPSQGAGMLSPNAAALLRQASKGSVASAILRQISLQSELSLMLEDHSPCPVSPHVWEVEGYEDILEEDHRHNQGRRASMQVERAHSKPLPALDRTIAAATAAMEQAGGLQAAVQQATAQATAESAAAAAASAAASSAALAGFEDSDAPPSSSSYASFSSTASQQPQAARANSLPHVHVPWQKKPVLNPLSGSKEQAGDASPLLSPRKFAAASGPGSRRGSGGLLGGSRASSGEPAAKGGGAEELAPAPVPLPYTAAQKPPLGPSSYRSGSSAAYSTAYPSSHLSSSTLASAGAASGSSGVPAGAASSAAGARQAWELSFAAPALEARYKRWVSPYLLRIDTSLGLVHCVAAVSAIIKLFLWTPTPASLLSLAGLLLMAAPVLPAALVPARWLLRRTSCLAAARLLVIALFAVELALVAASGGDAGSGLPPSQALLGQSGAVALFILPLRFPLPFCLHLPLHLLCLWICTAGTSFAHIMSGGATSASLPAAMLAQLLIGFLLSSLLVYRREAHLRKAFLASRRAAACLAGRQEKSQKQVTAGVAPLAG